MKYKRYESLKEEHNIIQKLRKKRENQRRMQNTIIMITVAEKVISEITAAITKGEEAVALSDDVYSKLLTRFTGMIMEKVIITKWNQHRGNNNRHHRERTHSKLRIEYRL